MALYRKKTLQAYLNSGRIEAIEHAKDRQTGMTTGIALYALAMALRNPGMIIHCHDHEGTNSANRHLFNLIFELVELLKLEDIKFSKANLTIIYEGCVELSDDEVELLKLASNNSIRDVLEKVWN